MAERLILIHYEKCAPSNIAIPKTVDWSQYICTFLLRDRNAWPVFDTNLEQFYLKSIFCIHSFTIWSTIFS
jgi:hypothetical protein